MTDGDKEKYYTQDELYQQKAEVEKRNNEQQEIFSQFEGIWNNTEDEASYMESYLDDNGDRKLTWNHSDGQGGYRKEEINVDEINIIEGLFGPELEILDGINWGCRYTFDLPYIYEKIEDIRQYCESDNISVSLILVDSLQKAKELPCVFNNWGVFYQGQFITVNLLDVPSVQKILKKEE